MTDSNCPIQEEYIVNSHHVIDIIYSPSQTPLLKLASQKKIPTQNGIEMLLFQGAEAFEIFTGVKAPIRIMRRALFESLEQVAP
jgi:shikimate dehydrogenase